MTFSTRADVLARRTYCRPTNEEATEFETWNDVTTRVIGHQRWLWERAKGDRLNDREEDELTELGGLILGRKALLAGRTLWLGGTDLVKRREIANYNCSFLNVAIINDVVDAFWLLLNGCGVGFRPVPGTLNGFMRPIREIEVVRSHRKTKGGRASNRESFDPASSTWCISVGDSGEAWAKAVGKLLAGKFPAKKLVLDFSEIRPAGTRLAGYGWVCSGDEVIAAELPKVAAILSRRAGELLTHLDLTDILNHLGVIQTGRRGAEIALYDYGAPGWADFARFKTSYWPSNPQRAQSNNSLVFWSKPSRKQLEEIFDLMVAAGGSEPGLYNGEAMIKRAPYALGTNPCGELLLSNKGLCNLVTTNLAAFDHSIDLHRAHALICRANYRQTLVHLDDGILQRAWHETNQFLRLCGASVTGIVRRPDLLTPHKLALLRRTAHVGAVSMANELQLEPPKNVTTLKPEGTSSKICDTTEGAHRPLGRYIFNAVVFSRHDALVGRLRSAGYTTFDVPPDSIAVVFPVDWSGVSFDMVDGKEVNLEPALAQLERYRLLMDNYLDNNCSITISYSPNEVPQIISWLDRHWDSYVGVSFLPRLDPTLTAKDLGYPYLPQSVVDKKEFDEYVYKLQPVDITGGDMVVSEECQTGACPIR